MIRYAYSLMTRIFYRHSTTRNGFNKLHVLIFEHPIAREVENEMINDGNSISPIRPSRVASQQIESRLYAAAPRAVSKHEFEIRSSCRNDLVLCLN